jgi:hypothetical protein
MSSAVFVAMNVVLAPVLLSIGGIVGVALANAIAYTVLMVFLQMLIGRELGPILNVATRAFALRAVAVNAGGYGVAALWSAALKDVPVVVILAGQALIILAANLLVVRAPPLSVPIATLWKR